MFEYTLKMNDQIHGICHVSSVRAKDQSKRFYEEDKARGGRAMRRRHRISPELEKEFQERSEAAYKFGFEDGKQIGHQEGKGEIKQTVDHLRNITHELSEQRDHILSKADEIIVRLAISVARTILHHEVRIDPTLVKNIARESLKHVEDKKRVSIKVHPSDWETIKEFEGEMLSASHGVGDFVIREDAHVKPGGCIIESDSGIVDAQLDTQVAEVAFSLMEVI